MIQNKIILIDDDEEFNASVGDFLLSKGYCVKTCSSADEALHLINKEFFDIFICDVCMPFLGGQEGGLELAKIISEKHFSSFTIIISQYVTGNLINKFLENISHNRYRFLNKSDDFNDKIAEVIKKALEAKYVFVCMPFAGQFDDVYEFGIKKGIKDLGFKCERADEIQHSGDIIEKVYNQIKSAHFIVADMSGQNANVFYEVGYAHALDKDVILLTQNAEDIPIDLKKYLHIVYESGRIKKLQSDLIKRITTMFSTLYFK